MKVTIDLTDSEFEYFQNIRSWMSFNPVMAQAIMGATYFMDAQRPITKILRAASKEKSLNEIQSREQYKKRRRK